jgi:hypothetical protein
MKQQGAMNGAQGDVLRFNCQQTFLGSLIDALHLKCWVVGCLDCGRVTDDDQNIFGTVALFM